MKGSRFNSECVVSPSYQGVTVYGGACSNCLAAGKGSECSLIENFQTSIFCTSAEYEHGILKSTCSSCFLPRLLEVLLAACTHVCRVWLWAWRRVEGG
ncbi:hypothetical protein BDV33DRAFT_175903 [Aspergillus novoparasiticus]|uniref:Uncharacterized protein n=1 Tax=Aspergillus novoparasiticus TaxID=986946 RepID=A0A5N6ENA4_9EURO|nr:hypothetical protein BDV33DRAFT_175903 [Aspergillus novoparasiticus]